MTPLAWGLVVLAGFAVGLWLFVRAVYALAALADRRRRALELWRVAVHPPLQIIATRTWDANGVEGVELGVFHVTPTARGERLTRLQEVAILTPEAAAVARATIEKAFVEGSPVRGLH